MNICFFCCLGRSGRTHRCETPHLKLDRTRDALRIQQERGTRTLVTANDPDRRYPVRRGRDDLQIGRGWRARRCDCTCRREESEGIRNRNLRRTINGSFLSGVNVKLQTYEYVSKPKPSDSLRSYLHSRQSQASTHCNVDALRQKTDNRRAFLTITGCNVDTRQSL